VLSRDFNFNDYLTGNLLTRSLQTVVHSPTNLDAVTNVGCDLRSIFPQGRNERLGPREIPTTLPIFENTSYPVHLTGQVTRIPQRVKSLGFPLDFRRNLTARFETRFRISSSGIIMRE